MSDGGTARTAGCWAWRKSSFSEPNGNECVEVGHWRKSSSSEPNGNACVEVAHATGTVGVRDSKNFAGPRLYFDHSSWHAFLGNVAPTD
jgi:hypothetical protein